MMMMMPCKRLTHLDHISEETMAKMNAMVINRSATTVTATGTTTLLTYAPLSEMYDRHVVKVHPFSMLFDFNFSPGVQVFW